MLICKPLAVELFLQVPGQVVGFDDHLSTSLTVGLVDRKGKKD